MPSTKPSTALVFPQKTIFTDPSLEIHSLKLSFDSSLHDMRQRSRRKNCLLMMMFLQMYFTFHQRLARMDEGLYCCRSPEERFPRESISVSLLLMYFFATFLLFSTDKQRAWKDCYEGKDAKETFASVEWTSGRYRQLFLFSAWFVPLIRPLMCSVLAYC